MVSLDEGAKFLSAATPNRGYANAVFLQAAALLAEDLRQSTIETSTRSVTWPTAAAFELATSPPATGAPLADGFWDLYSGNPGIALFLAAFSLISGEARGEIYRDLCLRALEPVRQEAHRLPESNPATSPTETLGALVGISSWVYALLTAGKLLRDPRLLEDAHTLSALISPARILAGSHHDLVFGSAGALLVLLALDTVDPTPNARGHTPFALARICARQIIAALPESAAMGTRGARSIGVAAAGAPPHRLGLSHGLAGLGLALSRLYRRTRDAATGGAVLRLLELAAEAPATVTPGPTARAAEASWCHGAAGLSVAFCGVLASGLEGRAVARIGAARRQAIERILEAPLSPQDHLCCGNMGRVAALAYVAEQTADPQLFGAACRHALLVLRVAKTRQGFALDYNRPDASFFRGYAGIGYTLLSLAAPRALPHVIALE